MSHSVFTVRNVLPVVTSVVATLFLTTAVPHELAPQPVSTPALARVELQQCMASGRQADDCLDEADGKALVERAELLARADDARRASR